MQEGCTVRVMGHPFFLYVFNIYLKRFSKWMLRLLRVRYRDNTTNENYYYNLNYSCSPGGGLLTRIGQ